MGDQQPEINGGSADKEAPQLENELSSGDVNGKPRKPTSKTNGTPPNATLPEITPAAKTNGRGRRPGSRIDDHTPPDNVADEATTVPEQSQHVEPPQEEPSRKSDKTQISKPQHGKRRRARPSTSPPSNPDRPGDTEGTELPSPDTGPAQPQGNRKRRGRNGKDSRPLSAASTARDEPNGEPNANVNRTHAESKDPRKNTQAPEQQKQPKKAKIKKNTRRQQDQESPQRVQNDPQPEREPEHAQRELGPPNESAESSRTENRRRSRARTKKGDSTAIPENEEPTREARGETARPVRRKTRASGETVPVTVHRLANVAMLEGDGDSSAGEESADELSTNRAIKLPNRGGVNPADVLSQVCRETLEKTLTTLKNGIANETHPARRSEIVRKTKAVEAYGAELEGRLLEISETLDNNYVLGVQAKRAKKEANDLRGRLYQIRKERQEVAMQMDEVRRKHSEDLSLRVVSAIPPNGLFTWH